jgi:hypothetical protein
MHSSSKIAVAAAAVAALWIPASHAEKKTVCTITVNSSDEKEAFRKWLPKDQYQFVELVEKGRDDWLRTSCQRGIQCDALIISGHFNAGETFYSDNIAKEDHLRVDELERASCSNSCPGLFAKLKEVYLFGCESLNPDATKYQSAYGESGRERMRRLFGNVAAIYGFSGAAPVGATAGALLSRYFGSGGGAEIATGRPNPRLLRQFSFNHMVAVSGVRDSDPAAQHRYEVCQFYDERSSAAKKLEFVHGLLRRGPRESRVFFERIEKLWSAFGDEERQSPAFTRALAEISVDNTARDRFLAVARESDRPEVRARMVKLAAGLAWLSPSEERGEYIRMVSDLISRDAMGFAEVDVVCALNRNHDLDADVTRSSLASLRAGKVSNAAALACLGDKEAHAQVLRALSSPNDRDVQVAQVYLRNRPLTDQTELRSVAMGIARMSSAGVQVRALDTLARFNIADREIFEELARAFAGARSAQIQRAIAEVFIRSDQKLIARQQLVSTLRQHRIRSSGGEDLIDVLIRRLQS